MRGEHVSAFGSRNRSVGGLVKVKTAKLLAQNTIGTIATARRVPAITARSCGWVSSGEKKEADPIQTDPLPWSARGGFLASVRRDIEHELRGTGRASRSHRGG